MCGKGDARVRGPVLVLRRAFGQGPTLGRVDFGDPFALGYRQVDDDPNLAFLVATMDETGRWAATRELRAWERAQIGLRADQRLLDMGCGPGEAGIALAADLGPDGELVGVDVSAAMVAVARERAAVSGVRCPVRFVVGDAASIEAPDGSFDAVRSERALQWVADPEAVVAEVARVLRPGGRLVLIDTDWSSLCLEVGDASITEAVRTAMATERNRPSNVGRRLGELVGAAGLVVVAETSATHVSVEWDPDRSAAPAGCFSMSSLADDLVSAGSLRRDGVARFLATVRDAARRGDFTLTVTMHAVATEAPS